MLLADLEDFFARLAVARVRDPEGIEAAILGEQVWPLAAACLDAGCEPAIVAVRVDMQADELLDWLGELGL